MNPNQYPLVSVIVPAYNIEKYISQTLDAVAGQTYTNIEIVIVNDGSTDGTLNILRKYAERDARIVTVNQVNKGLSAARNAGFAVAKGEYFCIIDADDIMMPQKIESQLGFLQRHPLADFTYSKVWYFIDGTHEVYIRDLDTPDGSKVYRALLRKGNLITPNSVFFKRAVFDAVGGFDEALRSAEDLDYWLFLSSKGVHFLHQDERLTLCRSRKDSLTADSVTMYTSVVRVFEKHLAGWSKFTSIQYLKNRLLLCVAIARKPSRQEEAAKASGRESLLNTLYHFLRRIKFSLTFTRVYDREALDYLISIEQEKIHESIR